DKAGLPRILSKENASLALWWDAAGRLGEVRSTPSAPAPLATYVYDAQGRRIAKIVAVPGAASRISYFVYDGSRLVGEANDRGVVNAAYAYLGYRPVAQLRTAPEGWLAGMLTRLTGAEPRFLHTTRIGQVVAMTDEDRRTLWENGKPGGIAQPLRLVGQYHDSETGLAYHGARFFEQASGKFLSPDPHGIADALRDVPASLLLDSYAYAGGDPQHRFDPDGAAKLTYYAITTGADGRTLGETQGFTKARWAFVIEGVAAGGDAATALGRQRNEFAANGTRVLFDGDGDFIKSFAPSGATVHAANNAVEWDTASGDTVDTKFQAHYGANLISISQFTITDLNDDNATKLIAYLSGTAAERKTCKSASPGLLPAIKFYDGEADIKVTAEVANGASKQRILACGPGSAQDANLRNVVKYEAAAEINETGRINRDCATSGCPGIGYWCDATRCANPTDQLAHGAPATTNPVYTPSYGRSQFVGNTLVSELLNGYDDFTAAERTALGLTPAIRTALQAGQRRGVASNRWYNGMAAAPTYAAANAAWANLPPAQRTLFMTETGLGEREYTDMKRMKTQPPQNSNGVSLAGDAREAFATRAIMTNAALNTVLTNIFRDFDTFTIMGRGLMRKNMEAAQAAYPGATADATAARTARAHNGGNWRRTLAQLTTTDQNDYVKQFLGEPGFLGKGNLHALRCTQDFGTTVDTLAPGTGGVGIGGLQFKALDMK
ncbi:MAG: RHS repeat-associated core domain-containing protein, partial [Herminiimonas sp.]|nr:RHS repeat-associated core domain-containing protein [Herminiimonas sp.]